MNFLHSIYEILLAKVMAWLAGITDEQIIQAKSAVIAAENVFAGPGRGAEKRAWVTDALKSLWDQLQPQAINLLIEIAVALVRKKL